MEDKLNRRSRPRPHDLRRKVLLKNFLKEQMTYIPHIQMTTVVQSSDEDFSIEASNSSELKDLVELNDENTSSVLSGVGSSNSTGNVLKSNVNNEESDSSASLIDTPASESKFFRFASVMKLRSGHKKKKETGIVKAKKLRKNKNPVKPRSLKSGLERLLSGRSRASNERSSDHTTRSSKTLFSMFKSRRAKTKHSSTSQNITADSSDSLRGESCTSNQSVQTDNNWSHEELSKVEQSNKLLKEENRLLSESLSYFMSNNSFNSHNSHWGSPLQSSNKNMSMKQHTGCYDNISSCSSYGYETNWNPRSRVLRSKSLHEQGGRHVSSRYAYRTRSMNCHRNLREFYAKPVSSTTLFTQQTHISQANRKNVLTNLPINNRIVQRRSSMPERTLSENHRSRMCRRSGSMRDSRTPFHALPSEAFY